jgi:hypothetical protein
LRSKFAGEPAVPMFSLSAIHCEVIGNANGRHQPFSPGAKTCPHNSLSGCSCLPTEYEASFRLPANKASGIRQPFAHH